MSLRRAVLGLVVSASLAAAVRAGAEDAAKIFERSCAPCHGKSGKPSSVFAQQGVRDFTDLAWRKATSDAQIEKTIREGKTGTMMVSFASQLTAVEIKGLAAYIRKLGGEKKK